jgi:hypothetical protein
MANLPIRTINGKEIEAVYATSSFSATSASYAFSATSASFVTTAQTASFVTASNVYGPFGSNSVISSSRAVTSSFATTASFVTTAQTASFVTASNVYGPYGSNSVLSSSYAITASYAADSANFANTDLTFTGQRTHNTNTNGLAIVTQPGGAEGSSFNLNDNFLEIRSNSGSSGTNKSLLSLSKDSYALFRNEYQGISLLGVSTNPGYTTGSNLTSTASMYIWSPRIRISGSAFVTGSITGTDGVINQLTASHAITASFVTTAQTASFVTASNVYGPYGSNSVISSSHAVNAANAFINGGNSFGSTSSIGLNDNQTLNIETSGTPRIGISGAGVTTIGGGSGTFGAMQIKPADFLRTENATTTIISTLTTVTQSVYHVKCYLIAKSGSTGTTIGGGSWEATGLFRTDNTNTVTTISSFVQAIGDDISGAPTASWGTTTGQIRLSVAGTLNNGINWYNQMMYWQHDISTVPGPGG